MGRVLFGMIDNYTRPVGGVKVVYQAVGGLRRRGFDAYVASATPLPTWLAGSRALDDVRILDMRQPQRFAPEDLYIATDAIGPHRLPAMLSRPDRRAIFVQNHNALTPNGAVDWKQLTHIRCLTVSEFSRQRLLDDWGFTDVAVVSPGVDRTVFHPGATSRRHRVAYMPRKLPKFADQLRASLADTAEWCPIDGASEAETAEILIDSTVFLNLGYREGFGLPPIEAMAAGCIVCGFAGEGTRDYATSENGFWADEGDGAGCRRAVIAALAAAADPARAAAIVRAGQATAERYSLAAFEDAMASYVGALL